MHTDIYYTGPNAEEMALEDIRAWIGKGRWGTLLSLLYRDIRASWDNAPLRARIRFLNRWYFYFSLVGVQGYPVRVALRHAIRNTLE